LISRIIAIPRHEFSPAIDSPHTNWDTSILRRKIVLAFHDLFSVSLASFARSNQFSPIIISLDSHSMLVISCRVFDFSCFGDSGGIRPCALQLSSRYVRSK
jgi:hypothetical protein